MGRESQDFSAPRAATASMSRKPKRGTLCFSCMTIRMQIDDRFISLRHRGRRGQEGRTPGADPLRTTEHGHGSVSFCRF